LTISDERAAREVSAAMMDVFERLGESLRVVRERCLEAKAYQEKVGWLG
jgi:hypothetical protein